MPRGRTLKGEAVRERILTEVRSASRPPTQRELADLLQINERQVRRHIAFLVADGRLIRDPYISRGLRLPPSVA